MVRSSGAAAAKPTGLLGRGYTKVGMAARPRPAARRQTPNATRCAPQEELDKQNPIIEDIDKQLHRVTSKLKSNNAKLKGLVLQVGARQ